MDPVVQQLYANSRYHWCEFLRVLSNHNKNTGPTLLNSCKNSKWVKKTKRKKPPHLWSPNSSRKTHFTSYPRRAFAYSWRNPPGTVSSMTVGYEGFREALGCGSEPVWRGAEPMKSPQRIRHPQLHVALMRRVRDFLTTPLPKRSRFSRAPLSLSFPSSGSPIFSVKSRVMLSPVQHTPSVYRDPASFARVTGVRC